LKLKYGPDIRFKVSQTKEKENAIRNEMNENIIDVLNLELENKYKEGLISRTIPKEKYQNVCLHYFNDFN